MTALLLPYIQYVCYGLHTRIVRSFSFPLPPPSSSFTQLSILFIYLLLHTCLDIRCKQPSAPDQCFLWSREPLVGQTIIMDVSWNINTSAIVFGTRPPAIILIVLIITIIIIVLVALLGAEAGAYRALEPTMRSKSYKREPEPRSVLPTDHRRRCSLLRRRLPPKDRLGASRTGDDGDNMRVIIKRRRFRGGAEIRCGWQHRFW